MSLEAWGDSNPDCDDYETWADRARDAGWFDPDDYSPGAIAIMKERERQETEEGFTTKGDDGYAPGTLARAAACYAFNAFNDGYFRDDGTPVGWPWDVEWWKPNGARADLVRAGALIAAEIDRLDRAESEGR